MNKIKKFLLLAIFGFLGFSYAKSQETINCVIKTEIGNIKLVLYPDKAPVTVANFLKYVDNNAYDGSSFFRACTPENEADREIKIEVIQGGNIAEKNLLDPIEIETTKNTGLLHVDGAVSMARGGPNTATSSFFICINDQPELDFEGNRNPDGYGFAVFGLVTEGMDVVKKIQLQKCNGQYMVEPITISSISRI